LRGIVRAFNGLVCTDLVLHGADAKLPKGDHVFQSVYTIMLLQICRDYHGLPDVKKLKAHEIRFFYDGLRIELREHTKPK
jgi:hypothetical protein